MTSFQPVRPITIFDNIQARAYWLGVAVLLGSSLWYFTAAELPIDECHPFRRYLHAVSLGAGTLLCISIMIFSRHDGIFDQLLRLGFCLLPALLISIAGAGPLTKLNWVKTNYCSNCTVLADAQKALDEGRFAAAITLAEICKDNSIHAQAYLGIAEFAMNQRDPASCKEAETALGQAKGYIQNTVRAQQKELENRHKNDEVTLTNLCATPNPAPQPNVTLTITPRLIVLGASATITWSSDNASKCVATEDWDNKIDLKGSLEVNPKKSGDYAYKITCTGAGGETFDQAQLQVSPPPVLAMELLGYREAQGTIDFRFIEDGAPVATLESGDVSIRRGNPTQDLRVKDLKWRSKNQPICVIAVVDDSGSIKNGPSNRDGLQDIRDAIARLNISRATVTNLELGMVVFNENIISISPSKSDLDPNRVTATGSYTHLWAGIQAGLDLAKDCQAGPLDRYLFVVTDGKNEWDPSNPENPNTRSTLKTVIDHAKEDQASICTVGIKSDKLDGTAVQALKDAAVGCKYKLAETTDEVGTLLDQYLTNRINSYRLFTTKNFCPLELKVRNEPLPVCQ